jgi:predicted RecB family nuclease
MKITSDLFEAYLKCPTKSWLQWREEAGTSSTYAHWVQHQSEAYRCEGSKRLLDHVAADECLVGPSPLGNLRAAKWRLAANVIAQSPLQSHWPSITTPCALESHLHLVERVPPKGRGKVAQFIPIRFVFRSKLTRCDRLVVAFDALVLSELTGRLVNHGRIIHGDDHTTSTVNTASLASEVRRFVEKISMLLADPSPPGLVLNRHCAECEFRVRCRHKAHEIDDLSLLFGMGENERSRHRSKGIFTVTQLSYTFRPRRTPKRLKAPVKPHNFALQALAIRENTVYVNGTPELPYCQSQIYLDIEGLPSRAFYYLIGALVIADGQETFHSFWANTESGQAAIFVQFAEMVSKLPDFRIFHYGDYDATAIKRTAKGLSETWQERFDTILERRVNVLSAVHSHVYFPTYSNSLKDLGRQFNAYPDTIGPTGLESIVWRSKWEATRDPDLKTKLIDYNRADCVALKKLTEFVLHHITSAAVNSESGTKVTHTKDLITDRPHWGIFRAKEYASEDLKRVNKCAYFDYQREKVLVRTHRNFRTINTRSRTRQKTSLRPNATSSMEMTSCPKCESAAIKPLKEMNHLLVDLRFSQTGVRKWITDTHSFRYRCKTCGSLFSSEDRLPNPPKYGHGLESWVIYLNTICDLNMGKVSRVLGDVFKIYTDDSLLYRLRSYMARSYQVLYAELLKNIIRAPVVHIDETTVRLSKGRTGYVWVLTSMDMVYYFYRPSREGGFLERMLDTFSGVLVSDFYTVYDSLACKQQKCLAHLVRDIDDDLLRHPLDLEFKAIAVNFGAILREIIETVDRYGLKKHHLQKHKKKLLRFLRSVASQSLSSMLAIKYQKRFQKSGSKMFTFLDHDGVPWNNNNAEHAIKLFAKHRRDANGKFSEESLIEYLVLASVLETCEFNNVSALDFLLSKKTALEGLLRMAGQKSTGLSAVT